jgi:Flp pilus assembly protein TadD
MSRPARPVALAFGALAWVGVGGAWASPDGGVPPARPSGLVAVASPTATFIVEPFTNGKEIRLLDHLRRALPALVAERFGGAGRLRFVGGPRLFAGGPAESARLVVAGRFDRQADWKIAVTVDVRGADGKIVGTATLTDRKELVDRTVLAAAWAALSAIPDAGLSGPLPPMVGARFGCDPYAFVLYGRALEGYFDGRLKPAAREPRTLEALQRSLVIDPGVPETRRLAGLVHLEAGRPGHARAMWSYALDRRPDDLATLRALAALDRTQGLPTARERYARLLELAPDDLTARRALGELLADVGDLEQAQMHLEAVTQAAPDDLAARRALALVLASRRAGPELVTELEQVARLDPSNLDARMDLGAAYLSVGRNADATAVYEDVLKRRPRHLAALKLAGDLALGRGDLRRAAGHFARLRFLEPQDPRPLFRLAAAHFRAGNLEQSERLFTEAAQLPGMLGEAYGNLGAIALARGQAKQALWFLSYAAKRRPNRALIRYNRALALHQLGREAEAANELVAAAEADPRDAGVRFLAGVVSLRLGLLKEAGAHFQAAVALEPTHADARHNLAVLAPVIGPRRESELSLAGPR